MGKLLPTFRGTIKRGKIQLENKTAYLCWLGSLEGKEVELTVYKRRKRRSKSQNQYVWGIVYEVISESTGYTTDEVHEAMKMLFLRVHRDGLPDTVRSTSDLTTAEFSDYVDKIKRWASEKLGCYIPDAGEVWE